LRVNLQWFFGTLKTGLKCHIPVFSVVRHSLYMQLKYSVPLSVRVVFDMKQRLRGVSVEG